VNAIVTRFSEFEKFEKGFDDSRKLPKLKQLGGKRKIDTEDHEQGEAQVSPQKIFERIEKEKNLFYHFYNSLKKKSIHYFR